MQLKKWHWNRRKDITPCLVCGEDHPTKVCQTRKAQSSKKARKAKREMLRGKF